MTKMADCPTSVRHEWSPKFDEPMPIAPRVTTLILNTLRDLRRSATASEIGSRVRQDVSYVSSLLRVCEQLGQTRRAGFVLTGGRNAILWELVQ